MDTVQCSWHILTCLARQKKETISRNFSQSQRGVSFIQFLTLVLRNLLLLCHDAVGYIFAIDEPAAAAECLIRVSQHASVTSYYGRQLMLKSQEFHSRGRYYLDASNRCDIRASKLISIESGYSRSLQMGSHGSGSVDGIR